jgi:ubiquinone/menaquinone biosynthesis C-methylase UbiE
MVNEARDCLTHLLAVHLTKPLAACRILDVGCGYGELLDWFHQARGVPAEQLLGIDVVPDRIAQARAQFPALYFAETDGDRLDLPDASIDLVSVFTVFSAILRPTVADQLAADIQRVLIPGGAVIWYDVRYPNPWNSNLKAVTASRIRKLFPKYTAHLRSITLLPPLARGIGRLSRAYTILTAIPVLRTHLLGLLIKP